MNKAIIKAVIVEDEVASRETLRTYLNQYCPNIEIVGEAESVQTGVALIKAEQPALVFLDIEMPFGNAFDLLEQVGEINFETIFVTAYSHYAIRALNCSAAYYLLKPVDIDELIAAVEKVEKVISNEEAGLHTRVLLDNLKSLEQQHRKVVLPVLDGFEVASLKEVVRCQANGNFTDFHFADGTKKMICRSLKFYEEALSDASFLRVHKSHLVNLEYIIAYKKGKGGMLSLSNGDTVDVSAQRKPALLAHFK
ncbi:MAG: LytR/AlgR family response regulator transcription factor [Bacteroidia bacterium]